MDSEICQPASVCTVERDYLKLLLLDTCSFHEPVELEPFAHVFNDNLAHLYYELPPLWPLLEPTLPLVDLEYHVCRRFIELLAPLTHHYFSLTSKPIYQHCLDIRGIEFSYLKWCHPQANRKLRDRTLDKFNGMKRGSLKHINADFTKNIVCHGLLVTDSEFWLKNKCNFVKNYKVLDIDHDTFFVDAIFIQFVKDLMHPGVDHLKVTIGYEDPDMLPIFTEFLSYCKTVETFSLILWKSRGKVHPSHLKMMGIVEKYALTATKLNVFIFRVAMEIFQFQGKKLQKCVFENDQWRFKNDFSASHTRASSSNAILIDTVLKCFNEAPNDLKYGYYKDIEKNTDRILRSMRPRTHQYW